jgi:hypothetical protein
MTVVVELVDTEGSKINHTALLSAAQTSTDAQYGSFRALAVETLSSVVEQCQAGHGAEATKELKVATGKMAMFGILFLSLLFLKCFLCVSGLRLRAWSRAPPDWQQTCREELPKQFPHQNDGQDGLRKKEKL